MLSNVCLFFISVTLICQFCIPVHLAFMIFSWKELYCPVKCNQGLIILHIFCNGSSSFLLIPSPNKMFFPLFYIFNSFFNLKIFNLFQTLNIHNYTRLGTNFQYAMLLAIEHHTIMIMFTLKHLLVQGKCLIFMYIYMRQLLCKMFYGKENTLIFSLQEHTALLFILNLWGN